MRLFALIFLFFSFQLFPTQSIKQKKYIAPYIRTVFSSQKFIVLYRRLLKKYIWVNEELYSGSVAKDGSCFVQLHINFVKRNKKNRRKYHSRAYRYLRDYPNRYNVTVDFVCSKNGIIITSINAHGMK